MRAMALVSPPQHATGRLAALDMPQPEVGRDELLVRVSVCGVCRTDLDLVDGRLVPPRYPIVPGHQVVGRATAVGHDVHDVAVGDRVAVAWIHSACGECRWCLSGQENLCPRFRGTGWHAHGGYAGFLTVPAAFAHRVPDGLDDTRAAPLLCAGAIGLRALRLAGISDGDALGLTGFGASAHLVLQLARLLHPASPVYVFARSATEREFALELGADWAGDTGDTPPGAMGAVIDTTPAWRPLVAALRHLHPGGRLVINAIRKIPGDQQALLELDYAKHLWMERTISSVANVTRADVREVLDLAAGHDIRPAVETMPLDAANDALQRLRGGGGLRGATVLTI